MTLQTGETTISCDATIDSVKTAYSVTPTSFKPLTFKLPSVFNNQAYSKTGTAFKIECGKIQNPRSLTRTASFSISISDQIGCPIATVNNGIHVDMLSLP